MSTDMIDEPRETVEGCKCEAQIADILARLEKLERESLPEHIAQALKKQGL